jgi:hypothetical protein
VTSRLGTGKLITFFYSVWKPYIFLSQLTQLYWGLGIWLHEVTFLHKFEKQHLYLCVFPTNENRQRAPLSLICSVLIGGFQIGQAAPYAEALATARSAAGNIYRVSEFFLFFILMLSPLWQLEACLAS